MLENAKNKRSLVLVRLEMSGKSRIAGADEQISIDLDLLFDNGAKILNTWTDLDSQSILFLLDISMLEQFELRTKDGAKYIHPTKLVEKSNDRDQQVAQIDANF